MIRKLLDSSWFYYALAALLLLVFVATQFRVDLPARSRGPIEDIEKLAEREDLNVLFILVDTLRADHLPVYGYERDTAPTLSRLAETGITFNNHVAQSTWTKTSMASLWTGTYPVSNEILRYSHAVPEEVKMPAEIFREAGYRTAGIFRNGWVGVEFGFQQGFETYVKPGTTLSESVLQRAKDSPHKLLGSDWDLTTSAMQFMEVNRNEKFFLYVHYMDVHQFVYEENSAKFGADYVDAYDNAIHWTDRNIEALLGSLEKLDLMDNTLVVFASDHGEAFLEHGLEGHAKAVYSEAVRTPWMMFLPWFLDEPLRVDALTENVDVWPTVLDIVGLEMDHSTDGRSLVPLLLGGADPKPGPAYMHLERNWARDASSNPVVGVDTGDHKIVWWKHGRPEILELYETGSDPAETIDIARDDPDVAAELRALGDAYLSREPSDWGASPTTVTIDEMKLSILNALGYVIEPGADDNAEEEREKLRNQ